jgi:hypothetical protein
MDDESEMIRSNTGKFLPQKYDIFIKEEEAALECSETLIITHETTPSRGQKTRFLPSGS